VRDFSTRPQRSGPAPADLAFAAVAGLALAWTSFTAFTSWREARERRAGVVEARAELESSRARLGPAAVRPADLTLAHQSLLTLDAPPARVLGVLGELMPADVRLESVSMEYGERLEMELRVVARSSSAYDVFLERLQSSPAFEGVLPGDENRDGEVRALVRATYRGAGAIS
jgi:hypothetical protein